MMLSGLSDVVQYTVESGDTLSSIADQYGTTWQQIADDNSIDDPNVIQPGQILNINTSDTSANASTVPVKVQTQSAIAQTATTKSNMTTWYVVGGLSILAGAVWFMKNKAKNRIGKKKGNYEK